MFTDVCECVCLYVHMCIKPREAGVRIAGRNALMSQAGTHARHDGVVATAASRALKGQGAISFTCEEKTRIDVLRELWQVSFCVH